jgi:hypothetical protein
LDDTARFGDAVHGGDDRARAAFEFFNGLLAALGWNVECAPLYSAVNGTT